MLYTLSEILSPTLKNRFAIPAFNTSSNMILTASVEVAEELNAPVIIQ